jgi:hypothetical protein
MRERRLRRTAGLLKARLPELDLDAVPDPRARERRWSIGQILRAALVGLMAGCKSLWETCALVSAAGRPCIDAIPIPADTNEMGWFQTAFASVVKTYGALFQMVTYDAGALSEANGAAVVKASKDYLFALKNEHRTMLKLATELLAAQEAVARTVDVLDNQTTVTRTLKLLAVDPSWSYDQSKGPEESVWQHAQSFLSVESVTLREGVVVENETIMGLRAREVAAATR